MSNQAIVNAAILSAASAEFVHHFLKERAVEAGRAGIRGMFATRPTALPDGYERTLLERKERLIDLALALYGCDESVVEELFCRNVEDIPLRCAALANETERQPYHVFGRYFGSEEKLAIFLNDATGVEILSLFNNKNLSLDFIGSLFAKKGSFEQVSTRNFPEAIAALTLNKQLFIFEFNNAEEEFEFYQALAALWSLSQDMPASALWASVLARLYGILPLEYSNLDHALSLAGRWMAPDERAGKDEVSYNELGHLSDWQLIRFYLGRKAIKQRQTSSEELSRDADLALRLASYASMEPTTENINSAFERDGVVCFAAFFQNPKLWQAASHRSLMDDLARRADQQSNNIDYTISMRSSLSKFLEQLEKDHPEWFAKEPIGDLNQEDEEATRQAEREARGNFEFSQLEKLSELTRAQRQTSHRVAILIGLVICCMVYFFAF